MKAIFVIDLNVDSLPVDAYASVYVFGKYSDEQEDDFLAYKRNIPVRPLPKKAFIDQGVPFNEGWNACLDKILGETE